MVRRTTSLLFACCLLGTSVSAQEWVVDGAQYTRLSPVGFGKGCSCGAKQGCDCHGGHADQGKPYAPDAPAVPDSGLEAPAPMPEAEAPAEDFAGDAAGFGLLASTGGTSRSSRSAAAGMIGDFFGGSYTIVFPSMQMDTGSGAAPPARANVPQAAGDRRFKIADNNSPFPVDRYFVNYNHFHNALTTIDGRQANLNRAVFGLEKAFVDGLYSFEVRVPFSSGLNSDQTFIPDANNVATEFGNIGFALKALLYQDSVLAASMGLGMVIPTAEDARIFDDFSQPFATIENEAFYLQPFAGVLVTPNDRFFMMLFGQLDFDTTGNTLRFDGLSGMPSGVIQDQTLLFLDASFGYWLYRDLSGAAVISGLAPMIELHHTSTLEDSDFVAFDGGGNPAQPTDAGANVANSPNNRLDVLNLTGGLRMEINGSSLVTVSAVVPLREGAEHLFDTEFAVQFVGFY